MSKEHGDNSREFMRRGKKKKWIKRVSQVRNQTRILLVNLKKKKKIIIQKVNRGTVLEKHKPLKQTRTMKTMGFNLSPIYFLNHFSDDGSGIQSIRSH